MPRRLIARLFLCVWLTLLGIEFAEQVGWFVFSDQAVDDRVDVAVVSVGWALKESPPEGATAAPVLSSYVPSVRLIAAMLEYGGDFVPVLKLRCSVLPSPYVSSIALFSFDPIYSAFLAS
jgi:hypothetical protein